jgi:hypothetical protein
LFQPPGCRAWPGQDGVGLEAVPPTDAAIRVPQFLAEKPNLM